MPTDAESFPNRDPSFSNMGHFLVINTLVDGALAHMQVNDAEFDREDWTFTYSPDNVSQVTEPLSRVLLGVFSREFPQQTLHEDNVVNVIEALRQFVVTIYRADDISAEKSVSPEPLPPRDLHVDAANRSASLKLYQKLQSRKGSRGKKL